MNKEVHYEGWLIKSPPTKRIWRARWRRRWFTLKQGEIPEQFCLEYYTDRNCRKLKGVIDLDQCEQVDCGLRLENRKQKFQFMFDIKTPKRTYYLAADTEADMRDWVNCICQVCHLHDTKQSNEQLEEQRAQQSTDVTSSTNNTTMTSLNSTGAATALSPAVGAAASAEVMGMPVAPSSSSSSLSRQSISGCDMLRRPLVPGGVVDQQPHSSAVAATYQNNNNGSSILSTNNSDSAYVNTEYSNRETLLCDERFDRQQLQQKVGLYLNSSMFYMQQPQQQQQRKQLRLHNQQRHAQQQQMQQQQSPQQIQQAQDVGRLAVNANGVVRKIPEILVLNNTSLSEVPTHSVQPSPALSTASGPYIPISECFSGSPKFVFAAQPDGGDNPTTPLNNLDPKFYDTPRSHNNIGLNLTNDQSYSPKITNCSQVLSQFAVPPTQRQVPLVVLKQRSHRSDSDSESVFTDDDEWTHPMPLRENVDRSTRPSDSSVENESFVLTYSQRFSKLPDSAALKEAKGAQVQVEKQAKVLKNKNSLILDFKDGEKIGRDLPQLSDTENTSPAIGPLDARSFVEESYDIPRSHNLPYFNLAQHFEKTAGVQLDPSTSVCAAANIAASPESNPIAASTPNLLTGGNGGVGGGEEEADSAASPSTVRTLPRPHCYTNAAPTKVEGNVFRYDFIEQGHLPPVNRKLKPKVNLEDKPPDEVPEKPPTSSSTTAVHVTQTLAQQSPPVLVDALANRLLSTSIQSPVAQMSPQYQPPSVNRKLKPNAYKLGNSATMTPALRRSIGAPLSMVLPNVDVESYVMETRTLPRQPRPNYAISVHVSAGNSSGTGYASSLQVQHQRTASAAAAIQMANQQHPTSSSDSLPSFAAASAAAPAAKNEHKLQYFDLDVTNLPAAINRQSISVGNLYTVGGAGRLGIVGSRWAPTVGTVTDTTTRAPVKSSVVYNSVDFVKTEAFKRIREERKKESEGVYSNNGGSGSGNVPGGVGGSINNSSGGVGGSVNSGSGSAK